MIGLGDYGGIRLESSCCCCFYCWISLLSACQQTHGVDSMRPVGPPPSDLAPHICLSPTRKETAPHSAGAPRKGGRHILSREKARKNPAISKKGQRKASGKRPTEPH